MIIDICDIDNDEERLGFLIKRYKFGHGREYEDQDFKFKKNDSLLDQAEACGQSELLGF